MTLTDALPGTALHITGFSDDLPSQQQEHLQAYGLVAGRKVRVLQHAPVTVVQVEHLELAMEAELANTVHVEQTDSTESPAQVSGYGIGHGLTRRLRRRR